MPFIVIIAAAAIVSAVPLLWWAVASTREPAADAVARNLAGGQGQLADLRKAFLQRSAGERAVQPTVATLARYGRRMTPAGMIDALEHKMVLGDVTHWGLERVLAMKVGMTLVGALLTFTMWSGGLTAGSLVGGALFLGVGYFGLDAILGGRAQKRQRQIERELPDTIDQITISVEAGLGFEAAMARVARTGTGPLARELSRSLQDIQLGLGRTETLDRLVHRTEVDDLSRFVNAVRQADGYGIPIAQVLRVQSAELRDKRKQRAEERAMKIPVKIVFPVVFCIFPALMITIVGPAGIRLANNFPG